MSENTPGGDRNAFYAALGCRSTEHIMTIRGEGQGLDVDGRDGDKGAES